MCLIFVFYIPEDNHMTGHTCGCSFCIHINKFQYNYVHFFGTTVVYIRKILGSYAEYVSDVRSL